MHSLPEARANREFRRLRGTARFCFKRCGWPPAARRRRAVLYMLFGLHLHRQSPSRQPCFIGGGCSGWRHLVRTDRSGVQRSSSAGRRQAGT